MKRINHNEIHKLLRIPLSRQVDQQVLEGWAASFWDAKGSKRRENGEKFVMMFPPPNITGNMHLGHALTAAVQDAIVRHRQMEGKQVLWVPGFDHAGLATQSIVDKQLWHKEGITRQQLGREKFIERIQEWKSMKLAEMKSQIDRLGLNLDHDREYFTMDKNSSYSVQAAFKKLFKEGIIYRSNKPVFWSEELKTTLSDIEVERVDGVDRYFRSGEAVTKRPLHQWFVNAEEMAHRAVEVVENSSIEMIPPNYKRSWSSWLVKNGVQDWCISRQSWWGHRIPAYKLEQSDDIQENWVVSDSIDEAEILLGSSGKVVQDPDVLDTWFSSSLLPLTVSGWPDESKFAQSSKDGSFPLHIMETGFDILNYWVSKMVMVSLTLTGKIPFKLILLHGMICDSKGKKMSKTKGNVIDPLDVIDGATLEELQQRTKDLLSQGILMKDQVDPVLANQKKLFPRGISACGADGLRAYLLSHDIHEEIVRVQILQIEKIRRLSNKIWNIYRLAISIVQSLSDKESKPQLESYLERNFDSELDESAQQVLGELSKCVHIANKSFNETYKLHQCFIALELFWNVHLSAKFIEENKSTLSSQNTNSEDQRLKIHVLIKCLVTSTKLTHPFMPHLTEFLYQKLVVAWNYYDAPIDDISKLNVLSLEKYPTPQEYSCHKTEI